MKFEWHTAKSATNLAQRGLDFAAAIAVFDDPDRKIREDDRRDYGETRYNMLAKRDGRVFFVTFTVREDSIRIISFRKANLREITQYGTG
jgi:uncharacterized protein